MALGCAAPALASADRYVYVSNGFPAGSNDISALHNNADGNAQCFAFALFTVHPAMLTAQQSLSVAMNARSAGVGSRSSARSR